MDGRTVQAPSGTFPRISIVTPSFNQGEYLEKCIDSILSQNYPNLEYMILDGGSSDNSKEIIKRYEKYLSFWRSAPDAGHYAAVQEGLGRASGEVLGWLNSDDMFHPRGLFVLGEVFAKCPEVEFLTGRRVGFDQKGTPYDYDLGFAQRWWRKRLLDPKNFEDPVLTLMQEGTYFRRTLWERAGSSMDLNFQYAGDFELFARFSRFARLYTVDETIAGFRNHGDAQRSKQYQAQYANEARAVIERELEIVSAHPEYDNEPPALIRFPLVLADSSAKARSVSTAPKTYLTSRDESFPRFSIVTPSYNQGEYLEEAIDSVLSQNYPNLEYIIMDGGSTDDSVSIIKRYEKYLSHWQSGRDEGQYAAINAGFARSTGSIMAWLNSDDKYRPGAFTRVVAALRTSTQIAWVTGIPAAWREDGEELWVFWRLPLYSRDSVIFTNFADPFIQQESCFWTRPLWDIAGGSIDLRWKYAADLDLWRRFFRFAQLYSINSPIGGCRIHSERRSGLHFNQYFREAREIVAEEVKLFKSGEYQLLVPPPDPIIFSS